MATLFRPAFTAGVAAVSASAIVFTSVITPRPDVSVAHVSSTVASYVSVELRAATQQLFPQRGLSPSSSLSTAQLLDTVRALGTIRALSTGGVTPTLVPTQPLINLANFIDAAYLAIEPWVEYAFDVAAYVLSWVPYGWLISDQIWVVYNFVESLVHSGVFNTTDWLRGQGSALKNISDWIVDAGLALIWLGLDELSAWVPLPPLPYYPPRPPVADLPEGLLGNVVVSASHAIASVSNGIWNIWEPIKGGIGSGVGFISGVLDSIAWVPFVPLINFELNEGWTLIATEGDALTGFAHDLINAGDQFVVETVDGDGLIAATRDALRTTLDSISARGGQAVQALVDWGRAQIDYFVGLVTPGAASIGQLATATDSSVRPPAAVARTLTVGGDGLTSADEPAARLARANSDVAHGATIGTDIPGIEIPDTDVADEDTTKPVGHEADNATTGTDSDVAGDTTTGDGDAPAPAKTAIDPVAKDSETMKTGLSKATRKAATDTDNEDAGKAIDKPGAGAQKPADKPGAGAQKPADKPSAHVGGSDKHSGTNADDE